MITAKELVMMNPSLIRRNTDLMRSYIQIYKDAFFVEPNCFSCSFQKDFQKLKRFVLKNNIEIKTHLVMGNYTLKSRFKNNILTYRIDNKPYRSYGYLMTDEFAKAFLSNGTKEELKQRAEMFEGEVVIETKVTKKSLKGLKRSDIDEMLVEKGLIPEDYVNLTEAKNALIS